MTVSFVRQLGSESGIQLNPLRDNSEIPAGTNSDQIFAIAMRATRGRIDKAFIVNRGNAKLKLGKGEAMRVTELNEAWVQVQEALIKGAYSAVVSRLITDAAALKYIVVAEELDEVTDLPTGNYTFTVTAEIPTATPYLMCIKHLDCFNDGIKIALHADENRVDGANAANTILTLRLLDKDDDKIAEYTGSLIQGDTDDSGNSRYLPDIIEARTDALEVIIGSTQSIPVNSAMYGYTSAIADWVESDVLIYFTEGGTAYTTDDYQRATAQLAETQFDYAYIASGGSKSPALITVLSNLMHDTNRQLRFDVPGDLTPDEAIAFVEQLNLGASPSAHLAHAFWAPFKSKDPTGINAKGYFGTASLNIAKACARNAQTNAKGFAPKNYPVAGREFPVDRTGIVQTYTPNNYELNALAKAKINPVIYENYTGGGRYVFRDSLTSAQVESSMKKLIAVADMSTSIDDAVTRYGKDVLQMPMEVSVKRMRDFLTTLFEGATASKWLVASSDPEMNGSAWRFSVKPNEVRPYDLMDVEYWLRYDGTNRQIHVTQTLSR